MIIVRTAQWDVRWYLHSRILIPVTNTQMCFVSVTFLLMIAALSFCHFRVQLLFHLIIDHLADFSASPDVFSMFSEQLKKTYFNILIKPEKLGKWVVCLLSLFPLLWPFHLAVWFITESMMPSSGEMCGNLKQMSLTPHHHTHHHLPLSSPSLSGTCVCWSWSTLAGPWWRSIRLWRLVCPAMSWWSSAGASRPSCTLRGWCRGTSAALWVDISQHTHKWIDKQYYVKLHQLSLSVLDIALCVFLSPSLSLISTCSLSLRCVSSTGVGAVPAVCHRVSQLLLWMCSLMRTLMQYNQIDLFAAIHGNLH